MFANSSEHFWEIECFEIETLLRCYPLNLKKSEYDIFHTHVTYFIQKYGHVGGK